MKKWIVLVLAFASMTAVAQTQKGCDEQCTFVLLSETAGKYQAVNKPRAKQKLSPFSTFKIANSLIALDIGVVDNLEQKLSFDSAKYPVEDWWPKSWYAGPLVLADAFKYSAVPVYREIAAKVGEKPMQSYLDGFNYGNQDISSGLDSFWLNGSLKISANEQVFFIRKLLNNRFAVSARALDQLKQIMLVKQTKEYKLYAKTGGGYIGENTALGWYVGFVENKSGYHYFALNLQGETLSQIKNKRIDIVLHYLKQTGVI